MEIRIGIKHSPRELTFDTDSTVDDVRGALTAALKDDDLLALSDSKGRQYLIAPSAVLYVELGGDAGRRVGFVS